MDLRRAKGWVGQLLEKALGADATSRAAPDFMALGVELKTIPIDTNGRPRETTFVCSVPLTEIGSMRWATSRVRAKLARVLWIPVEADHAIQVADRKIGNGLLWSPTAAQEQVLADDWESIAELVGAGYIESVTADRGRYLHMRPKGASAAARRWGTDETGAPARVRPKGFYLRTAFTQALLRQNYLCEV